MSGEVSRSPGRSGQLLLRQTGKGGRCRGTDGDHTAPRSARCPGHGHAGAAAFPPGAPWLGERREARKDAHSPLPYSHIPAPCADRGECLASPAGKGYTHRCPSPQRAFWGFHFARCHLSSSKELLDMNSYEIIFVCVVDLGVKAGNTLFFTTVMK